MTDEDRKSAGPAAQYDEQDDELDAVLLRLFQNQDQNQEEAADDGDFTSALMYRLKRQQRVRRFLLPLATVSGLALAAKGLPGFLHLVQSAVVNLSGTVSGWALPAESVVVDAAQFNGIFPLLLLALAISLFSGLLED